MNEGMLETVMDVVRPFVKKVDNFDPDKCLLQTGLLDSINVVQIILVLEERLGVEAVTGLSFEHFESCRTLAIALSQRHAA